MKISTKELKYIERVCKTAKTAGIDAVVIDQNQIRGITDDKMIVLLHNDDIPKFAFNSIGMGRVNVFLNRYSLVENDPTIEADVTMVDDADPPVSRSITLKGKGLKVDYRCANPLTIRAPKEIKDRVIKCNISPLGEALTSQLQRCLKAMGTDKFRIKAEQGNIAIEVVDVNNDNLTLEVAKQLTDQEGNPCNFAHTYPKQVADMLSANPNTDIKISSKGIMFVTLNELTFALIPLVEV